MKPIILGAFVATAMVLALWLANNTNLGAALSGQQNVG
jgi:hypothetical protein